VIENTINSKRKAYFGSCSNRKEKGSSLKITIMNWGKEQMGGRLIHKN
jgi:hypothetical protein